MTQQMDPEQINAVKLDQGDGTSRAWGGTGDAGHVLDLGVSGQESSYILTAANATVAAYPAYVDALTMKKGILVPISALPAAPDVIVVGWSTTAADSATIAAMLDALVAQIGTPGTAYPPGFANTAIISVNQPNQLLTLQWDGITTIKTVAMRSVTGAGPYKFALIPVEA